MITQPVKNESATPVSFINLSAGRRIAYRLSEGRLPGVVFLSGFRSDMNGAKAMAIEDFCLEEGIRYLRFDYSGCGKSPGNFLTQTIGGWKRDVCDMLAQVAPGANVLVGSSMGAWLMLLAALERHFDIAGLVGIASAPDFTERLIWDKFSNKQKKELEEKGVVNLPNCYDAEPYPITKQLIEEGRNHLLLDHPMPMDRPVRLIHGTADQDVPWHFSHKLMERIAARDISLELVKGGDHRLSFPSQLALICRTVEEVLSLA